MRVNDRKPKKRAAFPKKFKKPSKSTSFEGHDSEKCTIRYTETDSRFENAARLVANLTAGVACSCNLTNNRKEP